MKTVSVDASQKYDVIVGKGVLFQLGEYIMGCCGNCSAVIISDSNVFPLYGATVMENLLQSGITSHSFVIPAGEASKNLQTYSDILNFLAEKHITRSDVIVALGGGVVGDLAGFTAATYLRGISFVQIPTSLLAMVDSSVGGKTAVDLSVGKNLVGAFKQPKFVLCDVDVLDTLPQEFLIDGCAEVIKYAMLYDIELFRYLQNEGLKFDRETVISKCVSHKASVVHQDEFDTGLRQLLNLGHTIGHAVEINSGFSVSHGRAVAIGMAIVTKAAVKKGICDKATLNALLQILKVFSLPFTTTIACSALSTSVLSDKKRTGEYINLILPCSIGNCKICPTPVSELESFIKAGL